MNLYSQYGQEEFLNNNYFNEKTDGFFLDIGANDGVSLSNTKGFEELGWKGICVEPNPDVFKKLIESRNCKCLNVALYNETKEVDFLLCDGYTEMLSGVVDEYNAAHLNRIDNEIRSKGGSKRIVKVQTNRLEDFLDESQKIDVMFIDTEGSEYTILKSIDFNKYNIRFICFENVYNDHDFKSLLENSGYRHIKRLNIDDVYEKINWV